MFTPNFLFVFHCEVTVIDGLNYSEAGFKMFRDFYVDLFKFDFADFFSPHLPRIGESFLKTMIQLN